MHPLRRSPRIKELNEKAQVNNDQVPATKPIVLQDSNTRKRKEKLPIGQAREENAQRTPPHQLNLQSNRQMNIGGSAYMSHLLGINPMQVHDQFGFSSASFGQSNSLPQNQAIYSGILPREGQTTAYLYYPFLSSFTPDASTPSGSTSKQGTPMVHDNTSEQLRKLTEANTFGGSNPRTASHQLNHHISSFFPVTPLPHTNHSSLAPLQHPRNEQPPLPPYVSSEITTTGNTNTSNAVTSASVLGKRAAESYFQPPPPPVDAADDRAAVERGPQCDLQTVDLLSLVESVGTPEFLANSARVLGSMYEPRGDVAAAAVSSEAVLPPEPSLVLGLGDSNGDGKEKVWTYWNSSAMARTMERKRRSEMASATQASQALPVKTTLGLGEDAMKRHQ
uniref:Uncharacterized protein n=1 Tax=Oryza punctata TaxID=4537 RepID=A0A0E0JEN4_ORYPU